MPGTRRYGVLPAAPCAERALEALEQARPAATVDALGVVEGDGYRSRGARALNGGWTRAA